jgi:dGTPase
MSDHGGFDHNAQTLRIVTHLEKRYPEFDGLNLCWETLEGLVKHNGPLLDSDGRGIGSYAGRLIPREFLSYDALQSLRLTDFAGPEAQVAALSDDIAYNTHDIDDGLRAGFFRLEDLKSVPFLAVIIEEIFDHWPDLETSRAIHELGRRLITRLSRV